MTLGVFFAVLGAAFLHAMWNALIKIGRSKVGGMVILSITEVPIGLAVALFSPLPRPEVWPWVIAAGCTHFFYKSFLVFAYERGDLSRVYPIARGAAPMVVAVVGAFTLPDAISMGEYLGVTVLGFGILLMARGVFLQAEDRKLLPFALGSACATATYTLIDGLGARVSGDAVAYVAWVFIADGVFFAGGVTAWKGVGFLPRERKPWVTGLIDEIRSARAQMHVPVGLKIDLVATTLSDEARQAWARNEVLIKRLARVALDTGVAEAFAAGDVEQTCEILKGSDAGRAWIASFQESAEPWFNFSTGSGFYHSDKIWIENVEIPFEFRSPSP